MGAIKNGVKTIDDLIAYITPLEPYDQFQDLRLQVIGPEYAAADGTWVNIERVSFNEFEARYRKKHITPDENNEFVYYLNATSDPDHWKYYRKRTINDLGEPVEEYRREDIIVSPWHELPEIITDNLIKIDLGDMEEIQSKNIYIHLINYKMVIRVLDEVGIFPGIDYKPIHLGAIPNGQELELEFKDEEGYENTFWDQTVKGTLWGGINKELDNFDRKIKVEYEKEREGWVSHYPTLIEGNGFRPFALKYKFMPRNGKSKTGGEEKTKLNNLDFPLFEFLNVDDEKRAIKIECKTVYGFLAFTNRTFFAAGSTFDPEVGREEIGQFYSKYIDIVKNAFRERVNTLEELYKLLYYLPNGAFEHVDKMDLWRFLENALGQSVTNTITDREDILFKVLKILAKLNSPNVFLLELLRRKVGKKGLLERLIYRLDGDNYTEFVYLIWNVWKRSKFALFDETKNPALKLDGSSPVLLPYKSDKTLCFHHDNSLIDWDDSYTKIKIVSEIKTGKEVAETEFMGNSAHTVMVDEIVLETYRYHPFAPVVIINEDNPHFIYKDEENPNGQFTVLPAFVMLAREEKAFWDNLMTLAEYAIDIVTTFSGVGNILKAGRLFKILNAGKKIILRGAQGTELLAATKAFAGVIEITSGVGNGLLKLTGTRDTELGRAISEVLFYLEMGALAGELTVAINAGLKKGVREVLKHEDELVEALKKNGDDFKLIDEVIGELRRLADDMYIPNKLIKQEIRTYKGVKYEISIYSKKIVWKFLDSAKNKINYMELDDYSFVSFDFRIPDELLGKGFGKYFVDETFNAFKNQIKGAKANWTEFSAYPGGSSLGYKQFWKAYNELGDEIKALETTDFYQIMSKKYGISKIKKGVSVQIGEFDNVDITIFK